ncbi:GD17739 [Drosophila simulans]|uniref:GD17739 n=1 Tax=Drosophila simulans TaxID=7240 RepID=B4R048_DROSI|nr:GD17739 [Drosophila simulans]
MLSKPTTAEHLEQMDGWMKDAGCWMVGKTADWRTEDRRPEDCETAEAEERRLVL